MNGKKRSYNVVIWILLVILILTIIGSVTMGRYPIGGRELWGILSKRLWNLNVKPFWSKTQESLLLNLVRYS